VTAVCKWQPQDLRLSRQINWRWPPPPCRGGAPRRRRERREGHREDVGKVLHRGSIEPRKDRRLTLVHSGARILGSDSTRAPSRVSTSFRKVGTEPTITGLTLTRFTSMGVVYGS
jgi:hypothetical protein